MCKVINIFHEFLFKKAIISCVGQSESYFFTDFHALGQEDRKKLLEISDICLILQIFSKTLPGFALGCRF